MEAEDNRKWVCGCLFLALSLGSAVPRVEAPEPGGPELPMLPLPEQGPPPIQIQLLRKLWAASRSTSRLNLSEHEAILRIAPLPSTRFPPWTSTSSYLDPLNSTVLYNPEEDLRRPSEPPDLETQPGLADVISRGRIDSVMYVYFGEKFQEAQKEEVAGRIIQAVGGVVAAIAQVLTVLGAVPCVKKRGVFGATSVPVNIGFALLISNLLLLLAVHGTEPADVCGAVAVALHYLHLVVGSFLLAHTVGNYRGLSRHSMSTTLLLPTEGVNEEKEFYYALAAWLAPLPFILVSWLGNPEGYETRRYCWMSIEKGMVLSFIVPVFLLIGVNTLLVVLCLRHLLALRKLWQEGCDPDEETLDERVVSGGIRASAMLLPLLAIQWFLGVVALENGRSIFFQLAAAASNIALSWLVMYFLGEEIWVGRLCAKRPEFPTQPSTLFDAEPLISSGPSTVAVPGPSSRRPQRNWAVPGGHEVYELSQDAISTICK